MKIDFHVHSSASNDGTASYCHIAQAAAKAGLDAVFVCDHNHVGLTKPVFMEGVWLLPGCELSSRGAHVLGLLIDERLDMSGFDKKNLPTAEEAIEKIHNAGGLAVIAHPFAHPDSENFEKDRQTIHPDGVETANSRAWMMNPDANKEAMEYAKEIGVFTTGGSDAHLKEEIGNSYAVLEGSLDGKTETEVDAIVRSALLAKKSEAVCKENTKRIYKGFSQLERRNRSGRTSKKLVGVAYLCKCWMLDLLKK